MLTITLFRLSRGTELPLTIAVRSIRIDDHRPVTRVNRTARECQRERDSSKSLHVKALHIEMDPVYVVSSSCGTITGNTLQPTAALLVKGE